MSRIIKGIVGLFKYYVGIGYADTQVIEIRKRICLSCELFNKGKCGSCGCYIIPKTSLSGETCPEDKW